MGGLHEGRRFCAGLLALTGLSTKTAQSRKLFCPLFEIYIFLKL